MKEDLEEKKKEIRRKENFGHPAKLSPLILFPWILE